MADNESSAIPRADQDGTIIDKDLVKARKLPPVEGAELKEGQILGKVKIEREVGRGGMGAVYIGKHTTLDVPVAIKILPPEIAAKHQQFAERFMREARLAAKIQHPNVMGVLDADHDEKTGLYYIVLEFVDGGSVRDKMNEGPMSEARAVDIAISVAEALDAASDINIIHRDIKPDNIMLTRKGVVKLADMGIAKQRGEEDQSITMSSAMMGTPAYISPEQAMDAKNADARADIYSLGATMYHMLIGAPPYEGETTYAVLTKLATEPTPDPRTRRPNLSQEVADIIIRMMDKDKNRRPQTAKQLVEELSIVRSRIATRATAIAEGGDIKLVNATGIPQGTPTQGIMGTAPGQPLSETAATAATDAGIATVPQAGSYGTQPSQSTATAVPVGSGPNMMAVALGACIFIIGAVAIILALRGGSGNVEPVKSNVQTNPLAEGKTPAMTGTSNNAAAPAAPGSSAGLMAEKIPDASGFPVAIAVKATPAVPVIPKDDELVKQGVDTITKMSKDKLTSGGAIFKGNETPTWPEEQEARMVGFGTDENKAKEAAYRTALGAVIEQFVEQKERTAKAGVINNIIGNAGDYMRIGDEFGNGEANGSHYVAMSLSPRAAKLGKDLYVGGVEVKNLYELLGEPTVGIDMPEVVDNKDGGEKENRIRRAQRALENAFRAQGITTVDVTGVDKSKQREICDILVTGTSQATLRSQASLPGGTKPVYVYNCEMEIAVQLSPTNKQILANIYALKPMGDDAKKMMDFDSAEAAKKVMEANVANNIDAINKAMIDEWVKLSGDVDFWVGISGLEGGMDMLNVKKELKSIPGVKKVVPRYYKDGTQFVGLVYAENAQKLIEAMVQAGYKLTEMRGTKMIFKNKK